MKAIVIGSIPYSDSSRVVKVLTRDEGVIPVFVRISKKSGGALWHPLALLELNDLKRKNSGSLATFKSAERSGKAINTIQDPKRTGVAFFIAEVLDKSLQEGAHLETVFDVVEDGIMLLESDDHIANLHFYVLAKMIAALGLMPEHAEDGMSLHLETGEWYDVKPLLSKTSFLLKNELAELMIRIPGMDFADMRNLSLNQSDRKELLLAMVMFIQLHHAGLREIKSYDVLETIFD